MKFEQGDIITIIRSKYTVGIVELNKEKAYTLKCHASGKYAFFGKDFIETFGKLEKITNNNH